MNSNANVITVEQQPTITDIENELALRAIESQAVKLTADSDKAVAVALTVNNDEGYQFACGLLVTWKQCIKDIQAKYADLKRKTDAAHKDACRLEREELTPYAEAVAIADPKLTAYLLRLRREAEERERLALEAARREAEEQRESEIELAEASEATPDEVQALCNRPLDVMPAVVAPAPPRGAVNLRSNYKARVTDRHKAIEFIAKHLNYETLIEFDQPALDRLAKALKRSPIPGIEFYDAATTYTTPRRGAR